MMHTCGAGFIHHGTPGQVRRWQSREALAQGAKQSVVKKAQAHDDYLDGMAQFRDRVAGMVARDSQGLPTQANTWHRHGIEDTLRLLDETMLEALKRNQEERHGEE